MEGFHLYKGFIDGISLPLLTLSTTSVEVFNVWVKSLPVVSTVDMVLIFGVVIIVLLICQFWFRYKENKEGLLTTKVKRDVDSKHINTGFEWISNWFELLYMPSWQSVSTVIGGAILLFVLSHYSKLNVFFEPIAYIDGDHYQNLIAIHAGIGTIIFALLIFVAESLRKEDGVKDEARVLLKESFLFPLTVAEIISFFIFIWGDVTIWAIVPVMVMAILTITSLWKLLTVLLSKSKFAKKRIKLIRDRIKKGVNLAIEERLGNNILLNSVGEGKIELSYYPLSFDDDKKSDYHCFYSNRIGTVVDIKLNKLDQFAKLVEEESNRNGFSFYKEKVKPVGDASSDTIMSEAERVKFIQIDTQYFTKRVGDEVDEKNLILLAVDKRTVKDDEVIKTLHNLAHDIFIIRRKESFSEEIKLEIDSLEDQFVQAIEENKQGKIDALAKTYTEIAEVFLEAIGPYGGGYSYEQAKKETNSFFGGWNEIRWLSDSVREILTKAGKSHDKGIIRSIAYIPVGIAIRAINFGDQYLFQEFLRFPPYLYWLSLEETNENVREFMVDRSWRHLKETSDFYIENHLRRKAVDAESIKKYTEFVIPIFSTFQNLLKTAFDKRKLDDFKEFLGQFVRLYKDFESDNEYPRAEHLKSDLERTTDPKVREILEKRIEVQIAKEVAVKEIQTRKRQVVFGLSAWIFEKYRNNRADSSLANFYSEITTRLPKSLPELTDVFISSRTFETESFWNWDGWEMVADGEVHMIDFHSKLDRLYLVKALLITNNLSPESIEAIVLPHSRDLAFMAEDRTGTLISMLNEFSRDAERWEAFLPASAIANVEALKRLLVKAKEAQEEEEERFIETVEINPDKLKEFKSEVIKAFYERATIRPVLKKSKAFVDLIDQPVPQEPLSYGYNQIDRKESFIKEWHVHYAGWGENYGQGMASSENQFIFEQMLSFATDQKDVSRDDVIKEIELSVSEKHLDNPVVFLNAEHLFEFDHLRTSTNFFPHYSPDNPDTRFTNQSGYLGTLKFGEKNIPVVRIYARRSTFDNKILVMDVNKFGDLVQYSPRQSSNQYEPLDDIFLIRVSDLNKDDERRNKIISDNPAWLQEHENKEAYLRRQVLINFYERVEFKVKDATKARILNLISS